MCVATVDPGNKSISVRFDERTSRARHYTTTKNRSRQRSVTSMSRTKANQAFGSTEVREGVRENTRCARLKMFFFENNYHNEYRHATTLGNTIADANAHKNRGVCIHSTFSVKSNSRSHVRHAKNAPRMSVLLAIRLETKNARGTKSLRANESLKQKCASLALKLSGF